MPRRLTTTYSGRIAAATPSPSGPSLTVTVNPAQSPTPVDPRGYPLPRRHLVCAAARILRSPASPSPLLDLADYLSSHRLTLTAGEASEVVKALSPDPALALAFFRFAGASLPGFRHDAFSYNRILALLFRNRADPSKAMRSSRRWSATAWLATSPREVWKGFDVYEEMRRKGYRLDIFAYNMLLDALAKAGMVDQAYRVFEDMKQKHCEPDAYTYTILIRMSGNAGMTSKFLSLLEEMVSKGCALNLIAYNTVIEALGKNKMVDKVIFMLSKMIESGC
ncbi:hypothetical protein QOZ80_2BG0186160 [Eleusine coracana subsp. coracana]|nr:hypothetical protein QOZ80_2BG0186160 [Eleusine coracana subsp. coracana]